MFHSVQAYTLNHFENKYIHSFLKQMIHNLILWIVMILKWLLQNYYIILEVHLEKKSNDSQDLICP